MTRPREVILEAAFSDPGDHFTADELFDKARAIDTKTSRATLYRTIALLVEGGLLHEIDLGKGVKNAAQSTIVIGVLRPVHRCERVWSAFQV